jgi:hypothetical protein
MRVLAVENGVQAHYGTITLDSAPAKPTTLTLRLPLESPVLPS